MFNIAARDSHPDSLSRESEALSLSHCAPKAKFYLKKNYDLYHKLMVDIGTSHIN